MDIKQYMQAVGSAARDASREMARASTADKNSALLAMAKNIRAQTNEILAANAEDVAEARAHDLGAR